MHRINCFRSVEIALNTITTEPRCSLCAARKIKPSSRFLEFSQRRKYYEYECSHCGLLYADLKAALHQATYFDGHEIRCSQADEVGFDIFTLKMIAIRYGLAIVPGDAAQERALACPHSDVPGHAYTTPLGEFPLASFALGIMCRESELDRAVSSACDVLDEFAECLIVIDQQESWHPTFELPRGIRVLGRPLAQSFAAQRNFIQQNSRSPWVMQLDADETISSLDVRKLRQLATSMQGHGFVSIGIPRENYVDGIRSDLYPDTQYRLNRSHVVFDGAVHERPLRPWQVSTIAIGCNITHHLDSAHVATRSYQYDKISPGLGRVHEREEFAEPFLGM